jgi:hypothetical protein
MKHEPHAPKPLGKHWGIPVCKKCGLLYLKNELTQWCVRQGCNYEEHPEYAKRVKAS